MVEQQLAVAAKIIESQLDTELEKLDNLNETDLDSIRRDRIVQMRKRAEKKSKWIDNGHGVYTELSDEKEFFEVTKKSENTICHFYRDQFERCKIMDKHLDLLARKHIEAKFCKINAEKAPFLTERLKIRVLPTLCLVKDGKTRDYIVGFTDVGNKDDFSTEMLEWRIAGSGVIEYSGNLMEPPKSNGSTGRQQMAVKNKKTIRGRKDDSDDSDDSDY